MVEKKPPPKTPIPGHLRFLFGGLSGMIAVCAVQPLDLIKTRMQLLGPKDKNITVFSMANEVIKKNGFMGLYVGLTAALFRQATYTAGRLGSYNYLTDLYTPVHGVPTFGVKLLLGVVAGSIGAILGNPAEVALIRMTADGRMPPDKRRNYTSVLNALGRYVVTASRMVKEEGASSLLHGAWVTVYRAAVVNAAQLATYSQAREMLLPSLSEGVFLHFCASMISGFVTTVASQPLDIVKTRVQNEAKGGSQVGTFGVVANVIKNEGIIGLWSGFMPRYLKVWPQTVLTFVILEQINSLYISMV